MRVEAVLSFLFSLVLTKFTVIAIDDNTVGYLCDKAKCERGSCHDGSDSAHPLATTTYKAFKHIKPDHDLSFYPEGMDPAKDCITRKKGAAGDPHITSWAGKRFDYHGECDLVLLHSPAFSAGLGIDIHIRTTIHESEPYSYIESAALRIGEDIFEVTLGKTFVNGDAESDFPVVIGGYTVFRTVKETNLVQYDVELAGEGYVTIRGYKKFLSVDLVGVDLPDVVGLMGNRDGSLLARDGVTNMGNNYNEFGAEWQVLESEPVLFKDMRAPQHPREGCRLPSSSSEAKRRMLLRGGGAGGMGGGDPEFAKMAEEACRKYVVVEEDFDNCMMDVMLTGDVGMASFM